MLIIILSERDAFKFSLAFSGQIFQDFTNGTDAFITDLDYKVYSINFEGAEREKKNERHSSSDIFE